MKFEMTRLSDLFRVGVVGLSMICSAATFGQGFYGVSRVTPMAPARGVFFAVQGIGPVPRVTPTVSTYRGPGPVAQQEKTSQEGANSGRLDPKLLARTRARAVRGSVADQYRMGLIFARGLLGERDLVQARHWLAAAAHGKYRPAVVALAHLNESAAVTRRD